VSQFLIGNAPCSWGTLEFEGKGGEPIGFSRMLDELAETGYSGTELGDWGYMPTDPPALRQELTRRRLVMLGAFVPVALKEPSALMAGIANAVKTARLLAAVASTPAPFLVLADNNGAVPARTQRAGRITAADGLNATDWKTFAAGAEAVARAVADDEPLGLFVLALAEGMNSEEAAAFMGVDKKGYEAARKRFSRKLTSLTEARN